MWEKGRDRPCSGIVLYPLMRLKTGTGYATSLAYPLEVVLTQEGSWRSYFAGIKSNLPDDSS